MKRQIAQSIMMASLLISMAACGSGMRANTPSSSNNPLPNPGDNSGNNGDGNSGEFSNGANTAGFTFEDTFTFQNFLQRASEPTTLGGVITVDLRDDTGATVNSVDDLQGLAFGGTVKIRYSERLTDGTIRTREAVLNSGNSTRDIRFNKFVTTNGKLHFKAFFQDQYGAIVLVGDAVTDTGYASGRVYYHNFPQTAAVQGPNEKCWNITRGPYDCRDFLINIDDEGHSTSDIHEMIVSTGESMNPYRVDGEAYYKLLGRFSGLYAPAALNKPVP